MQIFEHISDYGPLCERYTSNNDEVLKTTLSIIEEVKAGGDQALADISERIDGTILRNGKEYAIKVTTSETEQAVKETSQELKEAIATAKHNVEEFHKAQMPKEVITETAKGVKCVQRAVPIQRIGIYIPGGKAPLFSTVIMLAVPAMVAGCKEIIMCTPANKEGKVNSAILYAAHACGIKHIYKVGGAQAIAAMAYGTESIKRVDKIFGPGNRYVTAAKQLVSTDRCAIDMPAGPSEVMVLADSSARAEYVAADLLSQAEHGADSQVILVCDSRETAENTLKEVERQTQKASRREIIEQALEHSRAIVVKDRKEMTDFVNMYAPEHLIVSIESPWEFAEGVYAAGSVFIGNYSPESAGDYASGTNHTLPTAGWARSYSGVNIDTYMRKITYQELTEEGLQGLANSIITMAEAEGLEAHANAVRIRTDNKTE